MKSVFQFNLSHIFLLFLWKTSFVLGYVDSANGRNSPSSLSFTASDEQSLIRLQIHTFPSVWWEVTYFL